MIGKYREKNNMLACNFQRFSNIIIDRVFRGDRKKIYEGNRRHLKQLKIDREDMLTLTRRMTLSRNSFTRVAGCYVDRDGEFDGSFNTNFLKLSSADRAKNLKLAKAVPFAETNTHLKNMNIKGRCRRMAVCGSF